MTLIELFILIVPLFLIQRVIYRLWFHPLARFPGPKLAASTSLYAAYFNLVRGGQYTMKLPELHRKYGPIVRTYPNELHIHDKEAYDQVFSIGTSFDKYRPFYDHPFGEGSHFNMPDLKTSKSRRDMFAPYLSKATVRKMEPLIRETLLHFIEILLQAGKEGQVINLTKGYHSFTTDAFLNYGWRRPFHAMEYTNFQFPSIAYMNDFLIGAVLIRTFHPLIRNIFSKCRQLVLDVMRDPDSENTLFSNLLARHSKDSGMTDCSPLSVNDLTAETIVFLVGGEESTANTLIHGTFHILNNDAIKSHLLQELYENIPDINALPDSLALEKLPYLTAVIKESLRFTHGPPGRLPRVVPAAGARLCGRDIPPNTIVSMSHYVYHNDEKIFPNPEAFMPERWMGDDSHYLDKHLISFSKGSRGCIGINLAYAELYLAFAYIFRVLDLDLHETQAEDLEWRDFYAPITKGQLKVTACGRNSVH
ncbi:hypothetical protein ASPZODRAFT_77343 [Penicilliopsis zonata CBS 506.65]|uniref:Cytochrome P450 n=1 Tax=Penicilliopsis zonata CBS 506.65 TaxID=1073090 RepID=A0A1L9S511_9EURO|nr:hypothetical protein ASPZODRAFT_77343 [Penicilliopsis zonata CBS 506.65]OJJ42248.1 hypothetical protein ASPZODRAFT_77343 [Penicilliopsis zonata CBS 506.65]